MGDLPYGTRDERGNRAPSKPPQIAPFWEGRWGKMGHFVIKCLPPWNAFHTAVTLACWFLTIEPNLSEFADGSRKWAAILYAINAGGIFVMFGPVDVFWFKPQNIDNFMRSFFLSAPLWTLIRVFFF